MSQADIIKALKIKTNSCKRTNKEMGMYLGEAKAEQDRVDKMKIIGVDASEMKYAVRTCMGRVDMGARHAAAAKKASPLAGKRAVRVPDDGAGDSGTAGGHPLRSGELRGAPCTGHARP
jgi:hypothetical protein